MNINNKLSKLLGNNKEISEVQIDQRVIDEIVKIAINADPNEYVALLSGKIDENILKITGLIFLPFKASDTSAVMQVFMMPMTTNAVGSIHSHPGPSAQPSNADLTFFSKNGYFHMIICRPYGVNTINAYDSFGNPVPFTIKDLGDEFEVKEWDELDVDNELFDEELLKELHELEDDEVDDNEKVKDLINRNITSTNESNLNTQEKSIEIENKQPAMINLEFEINGQIINHQVPLPPNYEPGDEIEVDIRTDKTPSNSIDEIVLNLKKSKENLEKRINSKKISEKSSQEIDDEIKEMESEIAKLKEENKRLQNS